MTKIHLSNKHQKPLVSFLLPTYNRSDYLKECLESIFKQIYKNFEIIIVDDFSTDNTGLLIEDIKNKNKISITYLKNKKNLGFYSSLNAGLKYVNGEYICFMADDDLLLETHLQKAIHILESDRNIALFSCDCFLINEKRERFSQQSFLEEYAKKNNFPLTTGIKKFNYMLKYGGICFGGSIFRKSIINDIGFFNNRYRIAGDIDLCLRISLSKYKIFLLKEPLVLIRKHEQCITIKNIIQSHQERINIFKNLLATYCKNFNKPDINIIEERIALELLYISIAYLKKRKLLSSITNFIKANVESCTILLQYFDLPRKKIKDIKL